MNAPDYQELLEAGWRRELTPEEKARLQACLSAHPDLLADWQAEAALSRVLRRLPEAPLASNFTAQVVRAVESEQAREERTIAPRWWSRLLWPKAAWVVAVVLLAAGAVQQYRFLNRTRIAQDLAKIPPVATLPAPEVLEDFDAIRELSRVPSPPRGIPVVSDEDLLAALQ